MKCATAKNGWKTENGNVHFYKNSKIQTGWVVDSSYKNYGLQRYWMGAYGNLVSGGKIVNVDRQGYLTYCSKAGYVARNKFKDTDGKFYLADNGGKLETTTGWLVIKKYDVGWQRYYIDASSHSVKLGFFKVDGNLYHGDGNQGYVVRGKTRYGNGMLLSNNDGILYTKAGWLITGDYDGGGLQRYYIDSSCAGYAGAHLGEFWVNSSCYFGLWDQGYVQRNCFRIRNDEIWWSNNDGVQTYYAKKCCGDDNVNFRIAYLWKDTMGGLYGDNAKRAFDYVKNFRYISGSLWPSGDWAPSMAIEMLNNGGGNCYRFAALFTMMIRAAGYSANAIAGYHNYGGVTYAHGWCEVYSGGQTYVCDPDGAHEQPGRNWYWVTYGNAPLAYRK